MARRDAGDIYSDGQVISALSQVSTNYVDFVDNGHQIGQGFKVPFLHVRVRTTFTGALTVLSIYFQEAPRLAGSTGPNATPGIYANTPVSVVNIPKAALIAGIDLLMIQIPITGGLVGIQAVDGQPDTLSDSSLQRFTQFLYVVDGIPTAGAIDAWLDTL